MIRLLSALALILSLSAVIRAQEESTPAMGVEMLSDTSGYHGRACRQVRCSRGFQCVSVRGGRGHRQPKCVRTRAYCEDLTGDYYRADEARPMIGDKATAELRREASRSVVTCRRDYDCNFEQGSYNQVHQYKCCRLRGDYQRRCVSVPSYTPSRRY